MQRFPSLNLENIKTYSLKDRKSMVSINGFGHKWRAGGSLKEFISGLPRFLAAKDLTEVVERLTKAVQDGRTVILAMGGHPIKVGLGPIIIDLMERGIISLLAVNGSVMVHDTEVALVGETSEDVDGSLEQGTFGMARETARVINTSAEEAVREGIGLGRALGHKLINDKCPFIKESVFASAANLDVPVTVHVALGTDITHIHHQTDGAALGQASLADFRLFCEAVATLEEGVFINLGSAVILPEVFLKGVSLARNLGYSLKGMTTVNMDFKLHYRPSRNVVERPGFEGGRGFNLIGHHEIMFPLLAAALLDRLD